MKRFKLAPVNKENWEKALELTKVKDSSISVCEGLAAAYIKPWDEALDPYVLEVNDEIVGFIYVSYTPHSEDNYWIGGLYIKESERGQGYATRAIYLMIDLLQMQNKECNTVKLTVEADNLEAKRIYEKMGFVTDGSVNKYGEIKYSMKLEGIY